MQLTVRQDFQKIIKEGLPHILTVQGQETYLNEKIRQALIDHLFPDGTASDFNCGVFDMETTPVSEALIEADSIPFFDDYRLVIIDNPYFLTGSRGKNKIDHDEEALLAYIQQPVPSTYMVFFAPYEKLDGRKKLVKALKKAGPILQTDQEDERSTQAYVLENLSQDNYQISDQAMARLFQLSNGQLTKIMNELEKLKVYKLEDRVINQEDVEALVPKMLDSNIFDMTDYVMNRQADQALQLFKDLLLQGTEPLQIIGLMASQFRLQLQVKILRDKGYQQNEIAKQLGVHPYPVKLAQQRNHRFSTQALAEAYKGLIQADYRIKSGQVDADLQFELFVLEFCQMDI